MNTTDLSAEFPKCMENVYCGMECGDGWKDLIRQALATFEACGAKVAQIKEKFGELRLYWDQPDHWTENNNGDFTWYFIACAMAERQAVAMSRTTCETCGRPGKLDNYNGWWNTMCDPHRADQLKRFK